MHRFERVLLTNDDGIDAPGLAVLEQVAARLARDVWVVAPAQDQSGTSHSISLHARDAEGGMTTVTVVVPLKIRQWGGRKAIIAPDGAPLAPGEAESGPVSTRGDPALVKALARAHRWRRMLEAGEHGNVRELAKAEKVNETYISRALRLTLLAPDMVEAILEGRRAPELGGHVLQEGFPVEWGEQRANFVTYSYHARILGSGAISAAQEANASCSSRCRWRCFLTGEAISKAASNTPRLTVPRAAAVILLSIAACAATGTTNPFTLCSFLIRTKKHEVPASHESLRHGGGIGIA